MRYKLNDKTYDIELYRTEYKDGCTAVIAVIDINAPEPFAVFTVHTCPNCVHSIPPKDEIILDTKNYPNILEFLCKNNIVNTMGCFVIHDNYEYPVAKLNFEEIEEYPESLKLYLEL